MFTKCDVCTLFGQDRPLVVNLSHQVWLRCAEASGAGLPRVESRADSLAGGPNSAPPTPRSHRY